MRLIRVPRSRKEESHVSAAKVRLVQFVGDCNLACLGIESHAIDGIAGRARLPRRLGAWTVLLS